MPNVAPSQVLLLGSIDTTATSTNGAVIGVTTGTSIWIPCAGIGILTFYLRSIGTTSGGTILIEEADWVPSEAPYTGTASQITSIAASSFTGGAQTAYHISNSAYGFVRVRISATITGGGTIAATLRAQQDS